MTIDLTIVIVAVVSFLLGSLLLPLTTNIIGNLLTPRVNKLLEQLGDWNRDKSLKRLKEEYERTKYWRDNPNQFQFHILSRIASAIPEFKDRRLPRDIRNVVNFDEYEKEALARIKVLEKQSAESGKLET